MDAASAFLVLSSAMTTFLEIPLMQLVLSVAGKILDSVAIDPKRLLDNDYLDSLRRLLLIKNELSIIALRDEPEFYVEAPSAFNDQKA